MRRLLGINKVLRLGDVVLIDELRSEEVWNVAYYFRLLYRCLLRVLVNLDVKKELYGGLEHFKKEGPSGHLCTLA